MVVTSWPSVPSKPSGPAAAAGRGEGSTAATPRADAHPSRASSGRLRSSSIRPGWSPGAWLASSLHVRSGLQVLLYLLIRPARPGSGDGANVAVRSAALRRGSRVPLRRRAHARCWTCWRTRRGTGRRTASYGKDRARPTPREPQPVAWLPSGAAPRGSAARRCFTARCSGTSRARSPSLASQAAEEFANRPPLAVARAPRRRARGRHRPARPSNRAEPWSWTS